MSTSFVDLRELQVRLGDTLTELMALGPRGFPTRHGTFDEYVQRAQEMIVCLAARTREPERRRVIEICGVELQQAHDAFVRQGDADLADRLLRDAFDHYSGR